MGRRDRRSIVNQVKNEKASDGEGSRFCEERTF